MVQSILNASKCPLPITTYDDEIGVAEPLNVPINVLFKYNFKVPEESLVRTDSKTLSS